MGKWVLAFLLACVVASSALAQQQLLTGAAATYRYAGGPITTFAVNPTDWVVVTGSATKSVIITKISLCGTATSATTLDIALMKRSTADSGGTITSSMAVNLTANNLSPTSTAGVYSTNPTLGTAVAQIDVKKLNLGPPTGNAGCLLIDYGANGVSPVALKGSAQQFAINLNAAAMPAGISLDWMIEVAEQ